MLVNVVGASDHAEGTPLFFQIVFIMFWKEVYRNNVFVFVMVWFLVNFVQSFKAIEAFLHNLKLRRGDFKERKICKFSEKSWQG